MDNGEVIPGLNEGFTLFGAKPMELIAGFVSVIVFQELLFSGKPARYMPFLLILGAITTAVLATLRKRFPDEERGMRNMAMSSVGMEPPDIPAPASILKYWSGFPLRNLPKKCLLVELQLDQAVERLRLESESENSR